MANEPEDAAGASEQRVNPTLGPDLHSPATKAAAKKAAAEAAAKRAAEGTEARKAAPSARPVAKKNVVKPTGEKAAARSGNPRKKAEAEAAARYTPPVPDSFNVSPWYIPVLMFGLLGVGMLVIFLNYMGWPFGDPSNWRLLIGLGAILGGILAATRYQ